MHLLTVHVFLNKNCFHHKLCCKNTKENYYILQSFLVQLHTSLHTLFGLKINYAKELLLRFYH